MDYHDDQHKYFSFAYQTGSDIWTHIPYRFRADEIMPKLDENALVLDIGAGRGLWTMSLLKRGYRVLGIDYVESIVESVNKRIAEEGFTDRARFIVANALDIPFVDGGFDAVTDVGTFQHIKKHNWGTYVDETCRVLKDNGYYLNISLSRLTYSFLGFEPSKSPTGDFQKFGVHYYFFDDEEIHNIFDSKFRIIEQSHQKYESKSDPMDDVVLVFTLMRKK